VGGSAAKAQTYLSQPKVATAGGWKQKMVFKMDRFIQPSF
jgi:hypothetical protein